MKKASPNILRKSVGLGFLPDELRHGFLLYLPASSAQSQIMIQELRSPSADFLAERLKTRPESGNPMTRVRLDLARWNAIAPAFLDEANRRLKSNGLSTTKLKSTGRQPVPIHPSLGKELCVLCWAIEDALIDDIPNAIMNWSALAPEERWWLYTMTVSTTGCAEQRGIGWRKALQSALTDNPFIKGDGVSPRSRRELLGHSQLSL